MGATIYQAPEEIGPPPGITGGLDGYDAYRQATQEWEQKVIDYCKQNGSGEYAGEIYRWQIADGYASYVVFKLRPLTLIWLNTGDSYDIPEVVQRGLTAADVRKYVEWERRWRSA